MMNIFGLMVVSAYAIWTVLWLTAMGPTPLPSLSRLQTWLPSSRMKVKVLPQPYTRMSSLMKWRWVPLYPADQLQHIIGPDKLLIQPFFLIKLLTLTLSFHNDPLPQLYVEKSVEKACHSYPKLKILNIAHPLCFLIWLLGGCCQVSWHPRVTIFCSRLEKLWRAPSVMSLYRLVACRRLGISTINTVS